MSTAVENIIIALFGLMWLAGIVIAKGFTSVFFAVIFPPWAWYLVVEYVMKITGFYP